MITLSTGGSAGTLKLVVMLVFSLFVIARHRFSSPRFLYMLRNNNDNTGILS
jgi:hypothetical protein